MIYRFVIVSNETPNFRRDIRIEGTETFQKLHEAIIDAVGYADDSPTLFQITDDQWRTQQEVYLFEMGAARSDEDIYLMNRTSLDELLEDERQKLLYVFDMIGDRKFFMELREITYGESIKAPEVVRSKGDAPIQHTDPMELLQNIAPTKAEATPKKSTAKKSTKKAIEEENIEELNEYDSEDFSPDEIDSEGFGIESEDDL